MSVFSNAYTYRSAGGCGRYGACIGETKSPTEVKEEAGGMKREEKGKRAIVMGGKRNKNSLHSSVAAPKN